MKLIMKKGVAYTGLADVFGGKLWFSVKNETDNELRYFYTKKSARSISVRLLRKKQKKHC